MACVDNIVCLGTFCSCGNITIIEVVSPITGLIRMEAEFNGNLIVKNISALSGSPISVPNIFNENYTHIVSFYNGTELINDTFYSIKLINCLDADNSEPMPFVYSSIIIESEAGNTITDSRIKDNVVTGLMINDVSKNTDYEVLEDTITFTDDTVLDAGQIITIFFE